MLRLLVGLSCLWLVCACQSSNDDALSEPVTQTPEGDFTHPGSEITFPEAIGNFERIEVTQYDESGDDMSVGYNLDSPDPITATVFVYPGRKVLDVGGGSDAVAAAREIIDQGEFDGAKEAILGSAAGLTLVSEDEAFAIANPREQTGRRAIYEGEGQNAGAVALVRTELDLFGFGDWFVKYRFTYLSESLTATSLILDFMNSLEWPED